MKKLLGYFLNDDLRPLSWVEFTARSYLAYVMIVNAPIGITIPLEDLGLPERGYHFIKTLWDSGYLMHLTKGIELVAGVALLLNAWVPLALVLLAPVLVNIFCIGFTVLPGAWTRSLPLVMIAGFLAFRNREAYSGLFQYSRRNFNQGFTGECTQDFAPVNEKNLILEVR
jgi:hypothetical protein